MKSLIAKIFFLFFVCQSCFAQVPPVAYVVTDGVGKSIGHMIINYIGRGYQATMNGEMVEVAVAPDFVSGANISVIKGDVTIKFHVEDGYYYHQNVGVWRNSQVRTSTSETGESKMYYVGNRRYKEELWLSGRLVASGETQLDEKGEIILWSRTKDAQGVRTITKI